MDQKIIQALMEKYDRGECSKKDLKTLESWYSSLGRNIRNPLGSKAKKTALKEKIWVDIVRAAKLFEKTSEKKIPNKKSARRIILYVAAACMTGTLLFWGYSLMIQVKQVKIRFNTIIAKAGVITKIVLPDHSTVWLHGAAILRYPKQMSDARNLYLEEGEAFFEVKHNDRIPFVVQTASGMRIQDLGTAFNIKTYPKLPTERIAVLSGSVKVLDSAHNYGILNKGQGADINVKKGTGVSRPVNPSEVNGWIKGRVILNNVSFMELAVALENTYGIEVEFDNEKLKTCRNSISFSSSDKLSQVMEILKTIYTIKYEMDKSGKVLLIKGQGCNTP